jgi:hypothetical protein
MYGDDDNDGGAPGSAKIARLPQLFEGNARGPLT